MIYMVELEFRNPAREHDWHTWYLTHTTGLIRSVPGFRATQRFRALTPTPSPWLALHEVESAAVFESKAYKGSGGPTSTGEWQKEHSNWHRNLYSGLDAAPDVPQDGHLLLAEAGAELPGSLAPAFVWLENAGLDRSTGRRGIAVLTAGRLTAHAFGIDGLRVYKPITPRITG